VLDRRQFLARGARGAGGATLALLSTRPTSALAHAVGSPTPKQTWANRAIATYDALQKYFYFGNGTGFYRQRYPSVHGGAVSNAWGFSRAVVATLTLAGIPRTYLGRKSYAHDVSERLAALVKYWDGAASPPAYGAFPMPPLGKGGDKYYDNNGWIGLALLQHYRMTGAGSSLRAAEAVFAFTYPWGWDTNPDDPHPGGLFWIQQDQGRGLINHNRTCTSNAPNAEIAFQLAQLLKGNTSGYRSGGNAILDWVTRTFANGSGLFYDHLNDDGSMDTTLRTYNQGAVIAAEVMRYRLTHKSAYLHRAETFARASLKTFDESYYVSHSCVFNAIYFRGLLQLYSVSKDAALKSAIIQAMRTYAEDAWANFRQPTNLFSFSPSPTSFQLLDQASMVQIFASLAWYSHDYPMLG
jgi:hypothetical protein